jgi:hypothetical protein
MPRHFEQPFDSIESTYDFFRLLSDAVADAKRELQGQIERESSSRSSRRLDALRVASYSVEKLELHVNHSRRILNDLRSLRRLLFEERAASKVVLQSQPAQPEAVKIPPMPLPAALHVPSAQVAKVGRVRPKPGSVVAA